MEMDICTLCVMDFFFHVVFLCYGIYNTDSFQTRHNQVWPSSFFSFIELPCELLRGSIQSTSNAYNHGLCFAARPHQTTITMGSFSILKAYAKRNHSGINYQWWDWGFGGMSLLSIPMCYICYLQGVWLISSFLNSFFFFTQIGLRVITDWWLLLLHMCQEYQKLSRPSSCSIGLCILHSSRNLILVLDCVPLITFTT